MDLDGRAKRKIRVSWDTSAPYAAMHPREPSGLLQKAPREAQLQASGCRRMAVGMSHGIFGQPAFSANQKHCI